MKKLIRNILALGVIVLVVMFIYLGGLQRLSSLRMPVVRAPRLPALGAPNSNSAAMRLTAFLKGMGVNVLSIKGSGGAATVRLAWPAGKGLDGGAALQAAVSRKVIRFFKPTGPSNTDVRYEGDVKYFIGDFIVEY